MSSNQDRTFKTATASNTWENIGALMKTVFGSGSGSQVWTEVIAHVLTASTNKVLVAVTESSGTAPTDDGVANTVIAGAYEGFGKLNFDSVWVKSPDGVSAIEFRGTPQ